MNIVEHVPVVDNVPVVEYRNVVEHIPVVEHVPVVDHVPVVSSAYAPTSYAMTDRGLPIPVYHGATCVGCDSLSCPFGTRNPYTGAPLPPHVHGGVPRFNPYSHTWY
jgi:hypothetical protein